MKQENMLVCLLDILGYKFIGAVQAKTIFDHLRDIVNGLEIKNPLKVSGPMERPKVRVYGDWILFTAPYLVGANKKLQDKFLEVYLKHLALFNALFIKQTGFYCRGAVTIGAYCEELLENGNGSLIYSEALNEVSILEGMARVPRVIVSKKITEKYGEKLPACIMQSVDSAYFLDIYEAAYDDNFDLMHLFLSSMSKQFYQQCLNNLNKTEVLEKYHWFLHYHNGKYEEWQKRFKQKFSDELILQMPYKI